MHHQKTISNSKICTTIEKELNHSGVPQIGPAEAVWWRTKIWGRKSRKTGPLKEDQRMLWMPLLNLLNFNYPFKVLYSPTCPRNPSAMSICQFCQGWLSSHLPICPPPSRPIAWENPQTKFQNSPTDGSTDTTCLVAVSGGEVAGGGFYKQKMPNLSWQLPNRFGEFFSFL